MPPKPASPRSAERRTPPRPSSSPAPRDRSAPSPGAAGPIRLAYSIPVTITPGTDADVEIRVSTRRRKSAQAHLEAGRVIVVVPSVLSVASREEVATRLALRLLNQSGRRSVASDDDLERRADELSVRYLGGVQPSSIRWVSNQTRRWGSCTPATGAIRLSARLKVVPEWVLDAVIVHELAHLVEASHSPAFKALVARYPRRAEADAFLLGFEQGGSMAPAALGPLPSESWADRFEPD